MKQHNLTVQPGRHLALGLILLSALATNSAIAADCLTVKDSAIEEKTSGYGVTTSEWTAIVHNDCETPYDGTLTIRLLDTDGHVLYEAVQIVVVEGGYDESISRRINISPDQFESLEDVEVSVKERERPR